MTAPRLFTQAELDALCRSPKEQMAAALESGDKEAAKQKYAELEGTFLAFHDIYYYIFTVRSQPYNREALRRFAQEVIPAFFANDSDSFRREHTRKKLPSSL